MILLIDDELNDFEFLQIRFNILKHHAFKNIYNSGIRDVREVQKTACGV